MGFEWDEAKNRANIEKHGIGFARASRIFDGWVLSWEDRRFDYGERRMISIGKLDQLTYLTVVHTDRHGVTRLISARPARRSERKIYEAALQQRTDE